MATEQVRVVVFAGSLRADSYNKKLARLAASFAEEAGAKVTYVDLKDLPMPIYDGDLEAAQGIPPNAKTFKEMLKSHHAMLIACPEYNSSISGVLKNAIDWASRPEQGEIALVAFKDKVAGIMSASPGALGGLRGLVHVRSILGNIQVVVVPSQVAISRADSAFGPDGQLLDPKQAASIRDLAARTVRTASRLCLE